MSAHEQLAGANTQSQGGPRRESAPACGIDWGALPFYFMGRCTDVGTMRSDVLFYYVFSQSTLLLFISIQENVHALDCRHDHAGEIVSPGSDDVLPSPSIARSVMHPNGGSVVHGNLSDVWERHLVDLIPQARE